ncbi:MAG: glutamyl-tRNA reductase [Pyrinomonadaceae bacterium]
MFALGVNHNTASIQVREKVYVHEYETLELLTKLRETLDECLVISTCNRTEVYGIYSSAEIDFNYYKDLLIDFKNASDSVSREDFFSFVTCSACEQLFNVATSIDSKIIGDTQVLQQIRRSYEIARNSGFTGKILNQLFQRALKIGKKTYLETSIHKGAVSISLAAVELARRTFDSLADKTVLIIGAGETAKLTAECLLKNRIGKLLVTNRTRGHAEEFLANLQVSHQFEGEVVDFESFQTCLDQTDIVISSTSSSDYILFPQDFENQTKKILLIDIAVPRDIVPEVAKNKLIVLKNIDDLNSLVDENYEKRMSELPQVKRIIYREMGEFLVWYYSLPLLPLAGNSSEKLSSEQIREIKKIRTMLESNAAWFRRTMEQDSDVESEISEHLNIVNQLKTMKEKIADGVCSFEK